MLSVNQFLLLFSPPSISSAVSRIFFNNVHFSSAGASVLHACFNDSTTMTYHSHNPFLTHAITHTTTNAYTFTATNSHLQPHLCQQKQHHTNTLLSQSRLPQPHTPFVIHPTESHSHTYNYTHTTPFHRHTTLLY